MAALAQQVFAVLVYPGLLLSLALSIVGGRLLLGAASGGRAFRGLIDALRGRGGLAYGAAVLLGLLALSLLPWPPLPSRTPARLDVWRLWAVVEAGALLVVLPGLLAARPDASRAAVREAQLGLSGRLPIWVALAAVSFLSSVAAPFPPNRARVVAALATVLAVPAAAGWPPFGMSMPTLQSGLIVAPDERWLGDEDAALLRWARRLQAIFWLALVAIVYVPLPPLEWWPELALRLLVIAGLAALVRGSRGLFVNRTLPAALRWCWLLALPIALLAHAI